jgi:antitoxin MazE
MHIKVQKWGNSQGLRFPKHVLQEANLNIGDELNIFVRNGKIILEPLNNVRNKYSLKELVSKMPDNYSSKELDWGPPIGKEEW